MLNNTTFLSNSSNVVLPSNTLYNPSISKGKYPHHPVRRGHPGGRQNHQPGGVRPVSGHHAAAGLRRHRLPAGVLLCGGVAAGQEVPQPEGTYLLHRRVRGVPGEEAGLPHGVRLRQRAVRDPGGASLGHPAGAGAGGNLIIQTGGKSYERQF